MQQDFCPNRLTAGLVACMRPEQDEDSQHSSMERGRAYEPLFLVEELWKESWWFLGKEESILFKGVSLGRLIKRHWMALKPMIIWAAQTQLSALSETEQ